MSKDDFEVSIRCTGIAWKALREIKEETDITKSRKLRSSSDYQKIFCYENTFRFFLRIENERLCFNRMFHLMELHTDVER